MKSKLFRTHIFGGYRKEDVDEYVKALEAEIVRLEEELRSGGVRPEEPASEHPEQEDFIVLDSEGGTAAQQDVPDRLELEELRARLEEQAQRMEGVERQLAELRESVRDDFDVPVKPE